MDKVIYSLSHGVYVLTTDKGGCVVDAVSQVSGGDEPLISVAVMKKNNTNELMHEATTSCLSIIGEDTDFSVISEFGYKSMRDYDKFSYDKLIDYDGLKAVSDSIGYLILEKVDTIENDTHTLFICKVIDSRYLNKSKEITYNFYREHKDELVKKKSDNGKTAWICNMCGFIYYGDILPDGFTCPTCGVDTSYFSKIEE